MKRKIFIGVIIRIWIGLLVYAVHYDYGSWSNYQTLLQMTGNTFFLIGVAYLFFGWGNMLYENSHGKNWIEAQYIPYDHDRSRKWVWFLSSLIFLLPAILITFYISFIKR